MVYYQRGDDTPPEEVRREERRHAETRREEGGLCPSEKTLKVIGFFVVVILLSVNLWFTINGSGPSQKYPPVKTLTPEETAQMIADAVKMDRNLNHHEPHHRKNPDEKEDVMSPPTTSNVPTKADMEKHKQAQLSKEAGVGASADITSGGGGDGNAVSSSGRLGKGDVQGDTSCSDKGVGHHEGGSGSIQLQ